MRITDVIPHIVHFGGRNFTFVTVDTDEGLSGVGEAALSHRERAIAEAVESLKAHLIGADPSRIEHLWQTMFRGGFFPAQRILSAAISAVDHALWDIRGKALGVPVYELLGGRVRDVVACYPHNNCDSVEGLIESGRATMAEGFRFIRFHVPVESEDPGVLDASRSTRRAIEFVAAAREELGDEVEICCDVHTRLEPAFAIQLCRAVEPYRPYFIEDPLRSEYIAGHRALRRHVHVPLAVGEHYSSKWEFRELIEDDLINYARIDPCIVGGITEAKKIAAMCETHYIDLVPHNPFGPVCTAAGLHLDLSSPNFGVQELSSIPGTYLNDVFPIQVPYEKGHLLPPDRPGLGVEFDREAAKAYPYEPRHPNLLRRPDGAFTNY
jgi:galactonate dehydratase